MELGTALAIVAFADQCLKYGAKLIRRCQSFRHAEQEVREVLVIIESNWTKMDAQITFLKKIAETLDPGYRDIQSRVLSELEGKLKTATLMVDQLVSHERRQGQEEETDESVKVAGNMALFKKFKYVSEKKTLEKLVNDMEAWQRRLDPSWILLIRMADNRIDHQLHQETQKSNQTGFITAAKRIRDIARESPSAVAHHARVFEPASILTDTETPIPFSCAQRSALRESEEGILIDTIICDPNADINQTSKDVRKLAQILSQVDPTTFGLLACRGVVKSPIRAPANGNRGKDLAAFKFLFAIPSALEEPKSLRAILLKSDADFPLNHRFDIAQQLTNSVLFVHSSQFVHKNIRPENIVVFENPASRTRSSFLVGFEKFRPDGGMSYRLSDGVWTRDLYRHPSRQGTQPEELYQMQHDIYSLGVVLLELGLWRSFVSRAEASASAPCEKSTPALLAPYMSSGSGPPQKDVVKHAYAIKAALVSAAAALLPSRMGHKYTDVVLLCLQCLDKPPGSELAEADEMEQDDDDDDGAHGASPPGKWEAGADNKAWTAGGFEDAYDEDGIAVGVRYIERILLRMQEISI